MIGTYGFGVFIVFSNETGEIFEFDGNNSELRPRSLNFSDVIKKIIYMQEDYL
jgi:hypothetical protein